MNYKINTKTQLQRNIKKYVILPLDIDIKILARLYQIKKLNNIVIPHSYAAMRSGRAEKLFLIRPMNVYVPQITVIIPLGILV